jgi:hypothetical protein
MKAALINSYRAGSDTVKTTKGCQHCQKMMQNHTGWRGGAYCVLPPVRGVTDVRLTQGYGRLMMQ